jgi:3-oxoacyl-(acyl-carrier-protein) synthase
MSLKAIAEAVSNSGCDLREECDVGLVIGSVWGDTPSSETHYPELLNGETLSPAVMEAVRLYPAGSIADTIGNSYKIRGPRVIFNNACASSNIALGHGLDLIRRKICRVVLVLGVDRFSLAGLWGAERSGFVGREMHPFDSDRKGTILGEGAAALLLEAEAPDVRTRAKAWLEGYACVCEPGAASITLVEDGIGLQMSMHRALSDAGCNAADVEYVNAHAPGTPLIDLVECRAIAAVWKEQAELPAVNATKSLTGHMSGASAIAEAIASILQMEDGFLHGNIGLSRPDPKIPIPVLDSTVHQKKVRRTVSNACGGGGLNTSVVIAARETAPQRNCRLHLESRVVLTGFGELQASERAQGEKELEWFDVHRWIEKETNIKSMNRSAQIGAAVGVMAIKHAQLQVDSDVLPPEEVAVIGGVWLGGWTAASAALCEGLLHDPVQIFPSTALNNFGAHIASMRVCRKFGFTGPTHTVCGNLASGLQALVVAQDLLRWGRSRAAVVMAYDSDDVWLRRALSWMPDCHLLHNFVEGGGGIVLEREDTARQRQARVRAVIHSGASTSGSLSNREDMERVCQLLLCRLQPPALHRIVLCGPADGGMRGLADILRNKTGADLELPQPRHSLAGEALLSLGRNLSGQATLVLAGESGRSQAAVVLCGTEEE